MNARVPAAGWQADAWPRPEAGLGRCLSPRPHSACCMQMHLCRDASAYSPCPRSAQFDTSANTHTPLALLNYMHNPLGGSTVDTPASNRAQLALCKLTCLRPYLACLLPLHTRSALLWHSQSTADLLVSRCLVAGRHCQDQCRSMQDATRVSSVRPSNTRYH